MEYPTSARGSSRGRLRKGEATIDSLFSALLGYRLSVITVYVVWLFKPSSPQVFSMHVGGVRNIFSSGLPLLTI